MNDKQNLFNSLVEAYQKPLYRYGYWLCGDRTIAEDLVQETFLRAWRALDSLQSMGAAKSWLITILRRENARRFQRKSLDYSDLPMESLVDERSSEGFSAELESLRVGIANLEEMYREPLLMQMVMGFTQEEISEQMEIPANTVATRLRRARLQLRDLLMDEEEEMGGATQ
ncbi:sigma-70 family RNA polymerase sigma factor [Aestuariirhabdus sp. Z084]|uniref:sigma-70 family RNA polymerase sigma factor n=1 Tax=Aestuariirhabdus haliotis TaxID=2918751 RepID=UPI00201B3ECF|nr:sigma-70 family RNA polymerase sigma factor [Aestuariirhabdus haliotis]MCL6417479.1 sigma-70 family RNA polymerase sigma factor [Aestuariirhabdus haliotis]MCL6421435.1 sigma-70 family RNA polymerase sigma factor [Aestuariirhabdus haliotis]